MSNPVLIHRLQQILRTADRPLTLRQLTIRANKVFGKDRTVTVREVEKALKAAENPDAPTPPE